MSEVVRAGHTQLLTGHFRQGAGYETRRVQGTTDWLFIYTLAGRGRFGYTGGELFSGPGDLVVLKPRTRHDYGVEAGVTSWELLWVHVYPRAHWTAYLNLTEHAPGLMRLHVEGAARAELEAQLEAVHALATGGRPQREDFAMNALERVLLLLDEAHPARPPLDPRVVSAQAFLRQHLGRPVKLGEVAAHCHLSPSRLSHLFRAQLGVTPLAYLEAERLERAKGLLAFTALPVGRVAAEVGFENPFYFTRRFRRWVGSSPSAFRQALRASAPPEART